MQLGFRGHKCEKQPDIPSDINNLKINLQFSCRPPKHYIVPQVGYTLEE